MMQPLDLVSASPWERVLFTTYALSLSFFEAVLLDRLVRGGGRNALILADPEGVRAGLSEQGARRAGREYELEPVHCTTGVFHPKLSIFVGGNDAHLLVGSGNLTFGGWGMNCETIEHLHPSFAADAFEDAAGMLEALALADNVRFGVAEEMATLATSLRQTIVGRQRSGNIRLLHSLEWPIAEQLAEFAHELGGATRLTIASPYFDVNGRGVDRLAERLDCDDVHLHVHPDGAVRGAFGTNWPQGTSAKPTIIKAPFGDDGRHLHAKCFEVVCRNGRLILAGSANATQAALFSGNVEASLLRIQRDNPKSWVLQRATAPCSLPIPTDAEDDVNQQRVGILRATLEGEGVAGQLIVPRFSGSARLSVATSFGFDDLGTVEIDDDGFFNAVASDLEGRSWGGGRMVLRLQQGDRVAEGFVSIAAAAKIIQRAGPMAPRLLAMLAGTETPEDVAAILSWFRANPERISPSISSNGEKGESSESTDTWVSVEDLHTTGFSQFSDGGDGHGDPAWQRALSLIRSAFSEPRGPWKSGTQEDDAAEDEEEQESEDARQERLNRQEKALARAMTAMDDLLDDMLSEHHKGKHVLAAFTLVNYLLDRVRPAPAKAEAWLSRVLREATRSSIELDDAMATSALLLRANESAQRPHETARRFLLKAGIDPERFVATPELISGFVQVLQPTWDAKSFLQRVRISRTAGEEVSLFLQAAHSGQAAPPFPILEKSQHWEKLRDALNNSEDLESFRIIDNFQRACPRCNIVMPTGSQQELQVEGVTRHCRIILCTEV